MQPFWKGRLIKWHLASLFNRTRHNFTAVVIACIIFIGIYQEVISYYVSSWYWYQLHPKEKSSRFIKVLIVADPQLQGYNDELPLLGYVTRFDADRSVQIFCRTKNSLKNSLKENQKYLRICVRYLAKTFRVAYDFVKPEMILFLGDLLDEGSRANRNEFFKSVERFYDIFRVPKDVLQLYVPGDNDVGGEGIEAFSEHKQTRFQTAFNHNDQFKNLVFYFMNVVEGNLMNGQFTIVNQVSAKQSNNAVDILVTHMSVLSSYNTNAREILINVQPNLILSAHDHRAMFMKSSTPSQPNTVTSVRIKQGDSPLYLLLSRQMIFELVSPTCSYRMGVPVMGYGSLLVEQLNDLDVAVQYTVLWNPQRYPQLYVYLFALIVIGALLLFKCLKYYAYGRSFFRNKITT